MTGPGRGTPLNPGCGSRRYPSPEAAEVAASAKRHRARDESATWMVVECSRACGAWHVKQTRRGPRPRRDTGPSTKTRRLVVARDGQCVCCGAAVTTGQYDIQHRDARGMGGTRNPAANSPVNLIVLCRPCHARVESRIYPEHNLRGLWLRMGQDPALTPVDLWNGETVFLTAEGGYITEGRAA